MSGIKTPLFWGRWGLGGAWWTESSNSSSYQAIKYHRPGPVQISPVLLPFYWWETYLPVKNVETKGFPGGSAVKESVCQNRRCGFNPWVGDVATHSSILAREIPGTEEPGGLTVHGGRKELEMTQGLNNSNKITLCLTPGSCLLSGEKAFCNQICWLRLPLWI